jgi:hypothetical protein
MILCAKYTAICTEHSPIYLYMTPWIQYTKGEVMEGEGPTYALLKNTDTQYMLHVQEQGVLFISQLVFS